MAINTSNQSYYIQGLMTWDPQIAPALSVFNITGPYSFTGNSGQSATVTYSFDSAQSIYDGSALLDEDNIEQIPIDQQQDIRDALLSWANVASITFIEDNAQPNIVVTEASQFDGLGPDILRFDINQNPDLGGVSVKGQNLPVSIIGSQANQIEVVFRDSFPFVGIDNDYAAGTFVSSGAGYFPYATSVHEFGHALGLSHPELDEESPNYNRTLTIMSSEDALGVTTRETLIATPMIYDIAAIQFLYGANDTFEAGDSSYLYDPNYDIGTYGLIDTIISGQSLARTIWDAGGTDDIDARKATESVLIDLRGGVDDGGTPDDLTDDVARFSEIGNELIAIAFGTTIENAIGGSSDDTIYGNEADNILDGGAGNDTLSGGDGFDTYRFNEIFDNDTIIDSDGQGTIIVGGDTLAGEAEFEAGSTWSLNGWELVAVGSSLQMTNGGNKITIEGFPTDDYDAFHLGISLEDPEDDDDPQEPPQENSGIQDARRDYTQAANPRTQFGDPLVLDLDFDGVELLSLENSPVFFDFNGDGITEATGWVNADDGLLAIDKNGNGTIDGVQELFGNLTQTGFEELAEYDSNGDGFITAQDAQFNELRIWQDLNQNGLSEASEISTLGDFSIQNINLSAAPLNQIMDGNLVPETSVYSAGNNSSGLVAEVLFALDFAQTGSFNPDNLAVGGDPEALSLPLSRGYQNLLSLPQAISDDPILKQLVVDVVNRPVAAASFASLQSEVEAILFRWGGVENIAGGRLPGFDEKKLSFLEKMFGEFDVPSAQDQAAATALLKQSWDKTFDVLFDRIAVQGPLKSLFPNVTYSFIDDDLQLNDNLSDVLARFEATDLDTSLSATLWLSNLLRNNAEDVNATQAEVIAATNAFMQSITGITIDPEIWERYINFDSKLYVDENHNGLIGSVANEIFFGTAGDDILHEQYVQGLVDDDLFFGEGGNDWIISVGGDDLILGGAGDDRVELYGIGQSTVFGGEGNDWITSDNGDDVILGGAGNDRLELSGAGPGTAYGGDGNDIIYSDGSNGIIFGDAGDDLVELLSPGQSTVYGGDGNDTITDAYLLTSNAYIEGNVGNDSISIAGNNNTIVGGTGDDNIDLEHSDIETSENIVIGGEGNDTISMVGFFPTSSFDASSFSAGSGNDTLKIDNIANTFIDMGEDDDVIIPSNIDSNILDSNTVLGGDGNDDFSFRIEGINNVIDLGNGDDQLTASFSYPGGIASFIEFYSENLLTGGEGNDSLTLNVDVRFNATPYKPFEGNFYNPISVSHPSISSAMEGRITLEGGLGNDTLDGNGVVYAIGRETGATDTLLHMDGEAFNAIDLRAYSEITSFESLQMQEVGDDVEITLPDNHILILTDTTINNLHPHLFWGGASSGTFHGTDDNNFISGSDEAFGGSGRDMLYGYAGNDSLSGAGGDDVLFDGLGNDILVGDAGADRFVITAEANAEDVITDFSVDEANEQIDLSAFSSSNITLGPTNTNAQHGLHTTISLGNNQTLILRNVYAEDLTLDDFIGVSSINGLNADPVAVDDTFLGDEDVEVTGNVLVDNGFGADSDPENDILATTIDTNPTNGQVILDSNGNFTYTPDSGFFGEDSFTYTLSDGNGGTDIGVVYLTIQENTLLVGTSGDDILIDDDGDDLVEALGGNDTIIAGSGLGFDTYDGGDGIDTIIFPSTSQGITADLEAGSASGIEIDTDILRNIEDVLGGAGDDAITGDAQDNALDGAGGNDTLAGGAGSNILTGGAGNDLFVIAPDAATQDSITDLMVGEDLIDLTAFDTLFSLSDLQPVTDGDTTTLTLSDGKTLAVTLASGSEALNDSPFLFAEPLVNEIAGTNGRDRLDGTEADDVINVLNGRDTVRAQGGDDLVYAGSGKDRVFGNAGDDSLYGGNGKDDLFGGTGNDALFGERGNDFLLGGTGDDTLLGGRGSDTILGADGNDVLSGEHGRDTLIGGRGDDLLTGGNGRDRFVYSDGGDMITDFNLGTDSLHFFFKGFQTIQSRGDLLDFVYFIEHDGNRDTDAILRDNDLYLDFGNNEDYIVLADILGNGVSKAKLDAVGVDYWTENGLVG